MNKLTLVIPAKKESETLPRVIEQLKGLECKILVSLPSDDIETIESIKNFNVVIHKQTGTGYGNSLIEGINNCQTEYFCIFNADGSFEKNDLKKMYELCSNNDFIFASRYLKNGGSDDDTIITFIGNKFFSLLGKLLFSLKLNDILYTFVMGKTNKFKKLNLVSNDFRLCVEFPIKMKIWNFKYNSIPSFEKKRIAGKKKVSALKDGFLILIEIIKLFINLKILNKYKN
tara:strand:- start:167 stop:853 length:687 start_codon:yes stop_codon:yes gene_type:complete